MVSAWGAKPILSNDPFRIPYTTTVRTDQCAQTQRNTGATLALAFHVGISHIIDPDNRYLARSPTP